MRLETDIDKCLIKLHSSGISTDGKKFPERVKPTPFLKILDYERKICIRKIYL
jgi:hypothetical protein